MPGAKRWALVLAACLAWILAHGAIGWRGTLNESRMGNPDLVLLDEPTEGLSPIMVMEVMKIIRELKEKGETILLVEQNSTLALTVSQRAYILENGHVVYSGPAEELIGNKPDIAHLREPVRIRLTSHVHALPGRQ